MKTKLIYLLILTSILTAFNYSENYGFLSPSLKVITKYDSNKNFLSFFLNVNSTNELKELEIKVYDKDNLLKTVKYVLQDEKRSFITFYYFVKKHKNLKKLTFVFSVKDKKNTRQFVKEIYL